MVLFPLPKRTRIFQGPHTTCLLTAETYMKYRKNYSNFDMLLPKSLINVLLHFVIHLFVGLFVSVSFVICGSIFFILYGFCHLFLRFQYKLSHVLFLIRTDQMDFNRANLFFIYCLHVVMIIIGGLGHAFLLFIES